MPIHTGLGDLCSGRTSKNIEKGVGDRKGERGREIEARKERQGETKPPWFRRALLAGRWGGVRVGEAK